MRGVLITVGEESFHTGNDLDLVQETKEISNPSVQTYTVQVPGRDGLLNLTKSLTGRVCYNNRKIELVYIGTGNRSDLLNLKDRFNSYHGQTIRIVDDDTPLYYYEGECDVECIVKSNYIKISIEVNALPFRYKTTVSSFNGTVSSTERSRTIQNPGVPVVPIVTVTEETVMTFSGKSFTLSAGTYTDLDIILQTGGNTFTFQGSGNYTISYQEARI